MKKIIFIFLMALLIVLPLATARDIDITCHYDEKPYFNPLQEIKWICEMNETTKCLSYIKASNGDLLYTNPEIEYVKLVGEISYFECPEICTIIFSPAYLVENQNYTFGVACENSIFERQVNPNFYLYHNQIAGRSAWLVDNLLHVLLFLFLIGLLIVIIVYLLNLWIKSGLPKFQTPFSR